MNYLRLIGVFFRVNIAGELAYRINLQELPIEPATEIELLRTIGVGPNGAGIDLSGQQQEPVRHKGCPFSKLEAVHPGWVERRAAFRDSRPGFGRVLSMLDADDLPLAF